MEIAATKYSAILMFHNLTPDTSPTALADWLWKSIGLALQEGDIEIRPLENGGASATVCVPRKSLADFLDRAVSDLSFNGRRVCVRQRLSQRPNPNDGRESER